MSENKLSRESSGLSVEEKTKHFYDADGWVENEHGLTGENRYFRDFGAEGAEYNARNVAVLSTLLSGRGGTVLLAGPGDLPSSNMKATAHFSKVVCVDISERSIAICKKKLGDRGEYYQKSLLEMPLDDETVDAVLCTHVIYHIHKTEQKKVIAELLRVTKKGGVVIIVYCNPYAPFMLIQAFLKKLHLNKILKKKYLYTYYYPLAWWKQFSQNNRVEFFPNSAISANQAKALLPTKFLKRIFYRWATKLEGSNPRLAVRLWPYVTVKIERAS
jgi:ubiquinone/menaquinone biosynthesis C-methylase UbiE